MDPKLQVESRAEISAQDSALAKMEEAGESREEAEDTKERLEVAHIAASNALDDSRMAKE